MERKMENTEEKKEGAVNKPGIVWKVIQALLGDIASLIPDHCNKVDFTISITQSFDFQCI